MKKTFCILVAVACVIPADSPAAPTTQAVLTLPVVVGQLRGSTDRKTSDSLLRRARNSMDRGNLELADWCLDRAERLNVSYDGLNRFGDTPVQLRAELNKRLAERQKIQRAKKDAVVRPSEIFRPQTANQPATQAQPATRNTSPISIAQMVDDSRQRAEQYLESAREALRLNNYDAAIGYYRSAVATGAKFKPEEYSPDDVAAALRRVGVDERRLSIPSPAQLSGDIPTHMPIDPAHVVATETDIPSVLQQHLTAHLPPAGQTPTAGLVPSTTPSPAVAFWSQKKTRTLQLLAQAQAALDRDDIDVAEQLARQARDTGLPDEAFGADDPRPWILLMEVDKRRNRQFGRPQAAAAPPITPLVMELDQFPTEPGIPTVQPTQAEFPIDDPLAAPQQIDPVEPTITLPVPDVTTPFDPAPIPGPGTPAVSPPMELLQSPAETDAADLPQPPPTYSDASQTDSQLETIQPNEIPIQEVPGDSSSVSDSTAIQHYQRGLAALNQFDRDEALHEFQEAWRFERELDRETREKLQGHLQNLAAAAAEEATQEIVPADELSKLDASQQSAIEQILRDISQEQAAIRRLRESEPKSAWERLKALRQKVAEADIDTAAQDRLLSRIDRSTQEMEAYIEQNRATIELDDHNREVLADVERRRSQRTHTQRELAKLVDRFNELMDQQRFPEASLIAKQAKEIDPYNPVTTNMVWKSQFARQMLSHMDRSERFAVRSEQAIGDVLTSGIPFPDNLVQEFPNAKQWEEMTRRRQRLLQDKRKRYTEVELEIQQSLKQPVDVQFDNVPLYSVLDKLQKLTGINIFLDPAGLDAHGVQRDAPISINLRKPVALKSALNLILQPLHLSYVIQDEVLRVTSELIRDGDVTTEVYYVADLVIPIPNFNPSYNIGLPGAIREAHNTMGGGFLGGAMNHVPLMMAKNTMQGGPPSGPTLAQIGASGGFGPPAPGTPPSAFGPGSSGGAAQADFDTLIDLITTTVVPESWDELGGPGNLQGFPTNLSLVVSQTQEVHERVADLLAQLRRLQDLQVTIEVRFITLSDNFFERMGVDFDFDLDDNSGLDQTQAAVLDDDGPSITVGIDPVTRSPTADLDLKFSQGSFEGAVPTFGGFDPNSAASLGFAILSDIEAFFVIEAAQGDSRSNILQAPKVTLFNGQQAFVSDTSQRPFVTSVVPVVGDFAAAHQPVITVLSEGTSLSVQAVVSNDRRFVRLTLVPFFSQIGDIDTFTFNGESNSDTGSVVIDPSDETNTVRNNSLANTVGTTVQLPTFSFTTVNTTVSVPDGGTILLGGIKRLREGRNEQGVPVLSKLPYINRLFSNVGIGKETQSLMMMVTPRIIIQEEEEDKLNVALP